MADLITIKEILLKTPSERKALYQASGLTDKNIDKVIIDNNTFKDYSAFTFLNEKTYVKSPVRSADGSIENLDSYAWFLTPHLKIDFSLMSIDTYRTMMQLIQSKSEFTVTCYDIVLDKDVTHKMYFATEQMPKLWAISKALNGGNPWVELYGVQDYTVELIGTNANLEKFDIKYFLNVPSGASWSGETQSTDALEAHPNITHNVGYSFALGESYYDVTEITFDNKYKFKYWSANSDGSGFKYLNGNEYLFQADTNLYAIWEAGAT